MITAWVPANRPGTIGDGEAISNTTVFSSGALIDDTAPLNAAPIPADSRKRLSEATTSADVRAAPEWKLNPSRRVTVSVLPSSL
ncbi:hypothetical protein D3C87_1633720 [compost metagenome]